MDFLSQDILRFPAATAEWTADTLSLGVSARVCKTSHWGCSVPHHAPLGMDSNSPMKVGEDGEKVLWRHWPLLSVRVFAFRCSWLDKELSLQGARGPRKKGCAGSSENVQPIKKTF